MRKIRMRVCCKSPERQCKLAITLYLETCYGARINNADNYPSRRDAAAQLLLLASFTNPCPMRKPPVLTFINFLFIVYLSIGAGIFFTFFDLLSRNMH